MAKTLQGYSGECEVGWGRRFALGRLGFLIPALFLLGAANVPHQSIIGTWENPHGTVRVKTAACGSYVCGWVIWASDQAIGDARDGGTQALIGTEILRDYRQLDETYWQGQVFVPDINGSFFSKIRQINNDQLKISGCILRGLICKSQLWHRS